MNLCKGRKVRSITVSHLGWNQSLHYLSLCEDFLGIGWWWGSRMETVEMLETGRDFTFLGSKIIADGDCRQEIKRYLLLGRKTIMNLDSIFKSRHITLPTKICLVKAIVFSSSHVCMCKLDYKENWVLKNGCFWTVVLEKTLESSLDC